MGTGYGDEESYEGCIYDTIPCDHCNNCDRYKMCIICHELIHYINVNEFKGETKCGEQKIFICDDCVENI